MATEVLREILKVYPELEGFVQYVEANPYLCVEISKVEYPPVKEMARYGDVRPNEGPFISIYRFKNRVEFLVILFGMNPKHRVICYRRRNKDYGAAGSFRASGALSLSLMLESPARLIDLYEKVFGQLCAEDGT